MLDIGWSELLLIGVVALIVVGPKDLPVMFKTLGRITARARQMAREFSRAMEDAARDTGLDDVASGLKSAASKKSLGLEALERATEKFENWDPKFPANRAAETASDDKAGMGKTEDVPPAADLDAAEDAFEPEIEASKPVATGAALPVAPPASQSSVSAPAPQAPAPQAPAPQAPAPSVAAPAPLPASQAAEKPPETASESKAAGKSKTKSAASRKKAASKKDEA